MSETLLIGSDQMFKTIDRYPDYEIDETGNIRHKGSDTNRKTYPVNGHHRVILTYKGKAEYVSRLVAETYIPNPDSKSDVRHVDGNKNNNRVSNLEWATHGELQKDSYGLGINAPGGNSPAKRIMILETEEEFPSIRACARAINGVPSGIRQCLNGNLESYKGYHYRLIF